MNLIFPITIATLSVGLVLGIAIYTQTRPEEDMQIDIPTNTPGSVLSLETESAPSEEPQDIHEEEPKITPRAPQSTPTPTVTPPPLKQPQQAPPQESSSASISFVDTPTSVRSGETFRIGIRITGEAGTKGHNASVTVKQQGSSQEGGSSSSVSNSSKQSFGSFTTPATFESTYSFASTPNAPLEVVATAEVDGKTLTATRTITIQ